MGYMNRNKFIPDGGKRSLSSVKLRKMFIRNLLCLSIMTIGIVEVVKAIASLLQPSFASRSKLQVDTGYAIYQGRLSTAPNLSHPPILYLGIPYAEAPTGSNRFRAPPDLDVEALKKQRAQGKIFDATQYPDFCIQGRLGSRDAGGAGSEDCLKVNIYAPQGAEVGSSLPVLVYIHGGSYRYGNPASWPFDEWVSQSPNVIIVSIYYRLSSIGFLAHPSFSSDLSKDSKPTVGDLNNGILDQRLALHWVNQNIHAFGGDPSRVTIMGQSAGAASVELQLVATPPHETSSNLFRAAILQSVYRTPLPTPQQQEQLFDTYAQLAGCGDALSRDKSRVGNSVAETMTCLRAADISALAMAQDAQKNISYDSFHPVLDGQLFQDYPTALLQKGQFHHCNIISGATSDESPPGGSTIQAALQTYFPALTPDNITKIEKLYPSSEFASEADRMKALLGDHFVRCGRQIAASASQAAGFKGFTYRFNALVPNATVVEHSADNWYLFNGTTIGPNGTTTFQRQDSTEKVFAAEEIAYLLSFVRTGDPNMEKMSKSPTWPKWDMKSKMRMVLNLNWDDMNEKSAIAIEVVSDKEVGRCLQSAMLVDYEQN